MTVRELMDRIHEAGGKLRVRDGQLYSRRVPECLAAELKLLKGEVVRHLHLETASDPTSGDYRFPRCPNRECGSFCLYRKNNRGDFTCESCGLSGITEARARRVWSNRMPPQGES